MPSEKVLELKKQQVAALKERLDASIAGVVVDYKGISVEDDTKLRKELREAGVEYTVVKNTLLGRAIDGTSLADMGSALEGTTAIATSKDDYVAAARILGKYADKQQHGSCYYVEPCEIELWYFSWLLGIFVHVNQGRVWFLIWHRPTGGRYRRTRVFRAGRCARALRRSPWLPIARCVVRRWLWGGSRWLASQGIPPNRLLRLPVQVNFRYI